MCGFFALFLRRPLTQDDIAMGHRGTAALTHRGPDAEGHWTDVDKGVYLGHRRLAIIDLSEDSAQPMHRHGASVAYNGEIYNFDRLRRDLIDQHGVHFDSKGDTEVLLAGWRVWGEGLLDRVDGMFGYALWDGVRAHVAVDPFGEKPLYWMDLPDGVALSSELGPLVDLFRPPLDFDGTTLTAFLTLGYVPAPATGFRGVHRLAAGCCATVEEGRVGPARTYWQPPRPMVPKGPPQPLSEAQIDDLEAALTDSIAGRLHADVPSCLFLSSGVDSSLVAALASRNLKRDLTCITVSFPGLTDEAAAAAETAAALGLPHEVVHSVEALSVVGEAQVLDLFTSPNDNMTVNSIHQMTQAARSRYTMGLTGAGADELFYGYHKHQFFWRLRRFYGLPEGVRRLLGAVAAPLRDYHGRFRNMADVVGVRDEERYLAWKNFGAIGALRRMPGFAAWAADLFAGDGLPQELAVPAFELSHVLPHSHLTAFDIGSMRSSMELRTPYLNRHLADVVAGMDPRAMMAFGNKSVLRRMLLRHLPRDLVDRKKLPFAFPVARIIDGRGASVPQVAGLPDDLREAIWARRGEWGWDRLAGRLCLAESFQRRHSNRAPAAADAQVSVGGAA